MLRHILIFDPITGAHVATWEVTPNPEKTWCEFVSRHIAERAL